MARPDCALKEGLLGMGAKMRGFIGPARLCVERRHARNGRKMLGFSGPARHVHRKKACYRDGRAIELSVLWLQYVG